MCLVEASFAPFNIPDLFFFVDKLRRINIIKQNKDQTCKTSAKRGPFVIAP